MYVYVCVCVCLYVSDCHEISLIAHILYIIFLRVFLLSLVCFNSIESTFRYERNTVLLLSCFLFAVSFFYHPFQPLFFHLLCVTHTLFVEPAPMSKKLMKRKQNTTCQKKNKNKPTQLELGLRGRERKKRAALHNRGGKGVEKYTHQLRRQKPKG